ncbi:MAG: OmpP1/FadL family transporter [Chitinophagaceae bacterium]
MTKRIFCLLMAIVIANIAFGQDETDALRYSQLTTGGTARVQAIGGAMGSLGGDVTALSVNPAGIGLFKTNEFVITPGLWTLNNQSTYLGNTGKDGSTSVFLGNAGLIMASDKRRGSSSKWQNVTVGIGINQLANFNGNLYLSGNNTTSSFSEKYIEELTPNGQPVDPNLAAKNYPFGSSLALNTYLLDPVYDNSGKLTGYYSNVFNTTGVKQQNTVSTSGGINEFSLGVAGNYADKFYIGASFNIPSIKYNRTNIYSETDLTNNPNDNFGSFQVTETLATMGVGINGKFGVIFKPQPNIRIGAAFHTPTVFSMKDTYETSMVTDTKNYHGVLTQSSSDLTNGYPGQYQYTLVTPWRAIASISYIFGDVANVAQQKGFLTMDYEYVNFASAHYRFDPSNPGDVAQADALNTSISKMYKGTSTIRLGGELKFDIFAVRAGLAWYGSPYQNSTINADRILYSTGVGYRNKGIYTDLTYVYSTSTNNYYPYRLQAKNVNPATVAATGGNIILSVGFLF